VGLGRQSVGEFPHTSIEVGGAGAGRVGDGGVGAVGCHSLEENLFLSGEEAGLGFQGSSARVERGDGIFKVGVSKGSGDEIAREVGYFAPVLVETVRIVKVSGQ
jgi:hypothetical protein